LYVCHELHCSVNVIAFRMCVYQRLKRRTLRQNWNQSSMIGTIMTSDCRTSKLAENYFWKVYLHC